MLEFFYDLPNLFLIIIFLLVSFHFKLAPSWILLTLGVSSTLPFLLNNVIFPAEYMPDQFKYFSITKSIRSLNFHYNPDLRNVVVASWFFSFIPLPFIETIKSLGFYNRLIISFFIIWLYNNKKIRGFPVLFLLFYPSLNLYSSLSLRDTLILILMVIPMISLIDGNVKKSIILSIPLYFLKFQNFFLLIIFIFFYSIRNKKNILHKFSLLFYTGLFLIFTYLIQPIIDLLNFYREAMFFENGGDVESYHNISNTYSFITLGLKSAPYFLMKPFPWESNNALQLIQSIENIFILIVLIFIFYRSFKIDSYITLTWLIYLIISMSVYGLVVFNYGTAVRYKFPFIVFIVVGLYYDLHKRNHTPNKMKKK